MTYEPTPEELEAIRKDNEGEAAPVLLKERRIAQRRDHAPEAMRLLPSAPDAELGVLSSFLLSFMEVGNICTEVGCETRWFHIPAHAEIYRVLIENWERNTPMDVIQLTQAFRNIKRLEQVGGAGFITQLFTYLPTAANVRHYLEIVKEKFILRRMIEVGTEYASRAYEREADVHQTLEAFEIATLDIRADKAAAHVTTAHEAVVDALAVMQNSFERKGEIQGIATGFADFDRMTDGLHPGEMYVIAARPSQGKTAFAMTIAEFIAVELQLPIAIFSLEMSTSQLTQRMLCSRARVDLARVRSGDMHDDDFPKLTQAASKLAAAKMYFDDTAGMTMQELRGRARRLKNQFGIKAIFIDYLQLLKSGTSRGRENRQLEVAEVSGGCKEMAKELGLPVVVLAQIGRDIEKRGPSPRPRLSDLRESGAIEQDADLVGFLVRAESYAETEEEKKDLEGQAEFIVAKQRNGPVGDIALTFLKKFTRFETRHEAEHEEPAAPPPRLVEPQSEFFVVPDGGEERTPFF